MPGSVLKAWNPLTSTWDVVLVGKQGAPGPTGPTGPAGPGVPVGGATNDLLVKNSGTNYDTVWTDSPTVDKLTVDTTAAETLSAEGQLAWNDTSGTLAMLLKGGVTECQIGETVFARVRNDTGAPILRGQAVYLSGSSGQKIEVSLARADSDTTSARTFGVVAETIPDNNDGFVITQGLLQGFDTNLLTEGAIVWLSPSTAGGLTTTKPVAPDHLVMVGICVKQGSGTSGSIFVKVQNGYELDEIHDVKYTNLAVGDLLTRTASNLWENITRRDAITPTLGTALGTTGTVNLDMAALTTSFQSITMTGDMTFTTSNRVGGRNVYLRLVAGGSNRNLTFPAWKFVGGAAPASITSGKTALLRLMFFGTADTDCVAIYEVEP